MKLKFPKTVNILSSTYAVLYDKSHNGGSFSMSNCKITIGIKSVKIDPNWTFNIISHEIMELVLSSMGGRFENGRTSDNFLFNFDHMTFESAIQVHADALRQFIA